MSIVGPQSSLIKISYAEFIKAGGGHAIPIPWNAPKDQFDYLLNSINGILFPGGDIDLVTGNPITENPEISSFINRVKRVLKFAFDQNKKGHYFPIWGVCQGFELITLILSQDPASLSSLGYLHEGYFPL